jgi:hypothetical protein
MPIIIVDVGSSGVADMLEEVLKASYFFIIFFVFLFNFAITMHSWQSHHNSMAPIDHLRNRLNFDLNKSRQKFHNSLKEHHKISNIPKFRCKIL